MDIVITHGREDDPPGFRIEWQLYSQYDREETAALISEGFCPCHHSEPTGRPDVIEKCKLDQMAKLDGAGICTACSCKWTVQIKEPING